MQRESRKLRAKLTQPEHVAKSEEMAKQLQQLDQLVAHNKAEKAHMRETEKARELQIRELATDVRLGSEMRDVQCRWVADFTRKVIELVRLDTMETVESRRMNDEDRQLAIELRLTEDDLDDIPIDRPRQAEQDVDADGDGDGEDDDLPDPE